jgi:hypothetical protein
VTKTLSILFLFLTACVANIQAPGADATNASVVGRPLLPLLTTAQGKDPSQTTPQINVNYAHWFPRGGFPPPCKAATPIALLIEHGDRPAFENIIVESNEGGPVKVEVVNCGTQADVSSSPLTLTLSHLGETRPVASARLPLLADCGGCLRSTTGSISLHPGWGVEDFVYVYHVSPGYYQFQLSGVLQVRGTGLQQEFTPASEPGPSSIVLFTDDVRWRTLPGTRRATVTSFRGTHIPWDWIDNVATGASQVVPWMLVDLVAHTPQCSVKQRWYVDVNHAEFHADGQGFQTRVPELAASGSRNKDEFTWRLMPLPAGTTRIRGTLWLDVHSCDKDQPVIAHSPLQMSASAPPGYSPPASVSPVLVNGKWEHEHYDAVPFGKLEIGVSVNGSPGSHGCLDLLPVTLGSLVCGWAGLTTSAEQVTLTRPVVIPVAIRAYGPLVDDGPIIWEGTLPPLSGSFRANEGAGFHFIWDQRDASGQQVPPGQYQIFVPSPIVAHYILVDQSGKETTTESSTGSGSTFIIP